MLFQQDKIYHLVAGAVIATVSYLLFSVLVSVLLVLAAAVGKEIYDYVVNQIAEKKFLPPPHSVDIFDAIATVVGGFLSLVVIAVLTTFVL